MKKLICFLFLSFIFYGKYNKQCYAQEQELKLFKYKNGFSHEYLCEGEAGMLSKNVLMACKAAKEYRFVLKNKFTVDCQKSKNIVFHKIGFLNACYINSDLEVKHKSGIMIPFSKGSYLAFDTEGKLDFEDVCFNQSQKDTLMKIGSGEKISCSQSNILQTCINAEGSLNSCQLSVNTELKTGDGKKILCSKAQGSYFYSNGSLGNCMSANEIQVMTGDSRKINIMNKDVGFYETGVFKKGVLKYDTELKVGDSTAKVKSGTSVYLQENGEVSNLNANDIKKDPEPDERPKFRMF